MFKLPENMRDQLSKPFGPVYTDFEDIVKLLKFTNVYAVGDCVTSNAYRHGITPILSIVDGKTKRDTEMKINYVPRNSYVYYVKNKSGGLSSDLCFGIYMALDTTPAVMIVDGEEDLAILPLIIYVPNDSFIIYGQPDEGVVLVAVNDELKDRVMKILSKFE